MARTQLFFKLLFFGHLPFSFFGCLPLSTLLGLSQEEQLHHTQVAALPEFYYLS